MGKFLSVVAAIVLGIMLRANCVRAAELAPQQPVIPPPVDLHGFFDATLKNDYLTPRGLLVANQGVTIQSLNGLILDAYNAPGSFLTDASIVGGVWLDVNPGYKPPNTNSFNEIDYFGGVSVKLAQAWTFTAQFVQFDSPQNAFFAERNTEVGVQYDDSSWNRVLPLNPYAKFFYTFKGGSSAVVTGHTATFDVEIGVNPKVDLTPNGLPILLSTPTWFTVGPSKFWGGTSNFGVFSTGVVATLPLSGMPSIGNLPSHYALHAGVQYYRMLNEQLLFAQTIVGTGVYSPHSDVLVPSIGISVDF